MRDLKGFAKLDMSAALCNGFKKYNYLFQNER